MYCITNSNGQYLKISLEGKAKFTNNESLAEQFNSEREATDFIRKTFPKKKRKNYKVRQSNSGMKFTDQGFVSVDSDSDTKDENSKICFEECIKSVNNAINTYLNPDIEHYVIEMQKYDRMILDIRHWLRDENTKLNAYQGWKTMNVMQELERKRAACKKELQRLLLLKTSIRQAIKEADEFDYVEYKNREIVNVREYLFG